MGDNLDCRNLKMRELGYLLRNVKLGLAVGTNIEHKDGMGIRFIHTADWQIGRAFRMFEARTAIPLEETRLACIDEIGKVAGDGGAAHVLVAGDVYDSPDLSSRTLRQLLERMRLRTDVSWWLLPGNHDPARAGGVWDRIAALGVPDNVIALTDPGVRELEPGVCLLPAPLMARSFARDPTEWMDSCETPVGSIRIGLAHGSIKSFGSDGAEAVIDPVRAAAARLDYLALGDWHGTTEINARTWYAGTPEPDRFRDNDPGNVLLVSIDGPGAVPVVQRRRTGRYTWADETVEITDVSRLAQIEQALLARVADPKGLLVQLALTGRLPVSAHGELGEWRDSLDAKLRYLDVDMTGLAVSIESNDFELLGDDAALREVAERLGQIAGDEASPKQAAAKMAVAKLFDLTRRAREVSV